MDNNNMTYTPEFKMKWHKFLIYFSLWAGALVNVISAVGRLTGSVYGDYAAQLYSMYPMLQIVEVAYGVVMLGIAVFSIVTRSALARYKENGPRMLTKLYVINIASILLYLLLGSVALEVSIGTVMDARTLGQIAGAVAMIFINKTYYGKREELFVN